jgi:hypothetical protein
MKNQGNNAGKECIIVRHQKILYKILLSIFSSLKVLTYAYHTKLAFRIWRKPQKRNK